MLTLPGNPQDWLEGERVQVTRPLFWTMKATVVKTQSIQQIGWRDVYLLIKPDEGSPVKREMWVSARWCAPEGEMDV